ncbi:OmpH family outer membrane protein [Gallaecimonas sp. GXIMD4217]|uniref:OmpH family outer membrane protein n=1 Tax=Gallaecimonas sp. GXIMD4217 TaxID=3131927 RepID=UPI00311B3A80
MKKLINAAGLGLALSAATLAMPAAAEGKIAVVDMGRIFQALPQREMVESKLKAEFADRIEAVRKLEEEMQGLAEKARRDGAIMTDDQKKELSRKMESLQADYQLKRKAMDEDMRKRQGDERNMLLEKIQTAINEVAASGNYDVVLQRNAVAYIKSDVDISAKVIDKVSKGN